MSIYTIYGSTGEKKKFLTGKRNYLDVLDQISQTGSIFKWMDP